MKLGILLLVLLGSLANFNAFAEGGTFYFRGVNFLLARSACSILSIEQGEFLSLSAGPNSFAIDRVSSGRFSPVIRYSVPSEGQYLFEGDGAFRSTNEFETDSLDFKEVSGAIVIERLSDSVQCELIECPAFGPCK